MEKYVELIVGAVAAMIIMILHELPKSIAYLVMSEKQIKENSKILKLWNYIDPVGVLFAVVSYAPFSKPYMYRVNKRRTNAVLGMVGFLILFLIYFGGILILRSQFGGFEGLQKLEELGVSYRLVVGLFLYYFCIMSFGMVMVNLFPVSTFDMGLLIAAKSPSKYLGIIENDNKIKLILIFVLIFEIIRLEAGFLTQYFLTL